MCQLKESKIIVEGAFARVLELMWPSSLNLFTCLAISHVESGAGVQFTILHILQLSVPCQIKDKMSISQNVHLPPPPCPTLSNFGTKAVEFLRKKWAADFLPLQTTSLFKWPPLCRCQSRFYFARIHWGASARHPMRRVSNFWHGSVRVSLDSKSISTDIQQESVATKDGSKDWKRRIFWLSSKNFISRIGQF